MNKSPESRIQKSASRIGILCAACLTVVLVTAGCGTSANLSGLSAAVNFAQKGTVVGVTVAGGSNSVTLGATYGSGTNQIGGTATIPGL